MGIALLVRISSAKTIELGSNSKMMVEPPNWKYPCSSPLQLVISIGMKPRKRATSREIEKARK
jgi:hypothetical protein